MSLNKSQIKSELKNCPIDLASYYLTMGAALVMYGIREYTNDIDIGCKSHCFEKLINDGYVALKSSSGLEKISFSNTITIYKDWPVNEIVLIDGVPTADLQSIIEIKSIFNRDKDIDDLIKITDFLKQQKITEN